MRRTHSIALAILVLGLSTGCATSFSPEKIRKEIRTQRGEDPLAAFELNLGRFTTLVIKNALAGQDGELPFAGLTSLQVAAYEVSAPSGPALDVTRIKVRGWEPVLRAHDEKRSALVLVREKGEMIGDLVVVGSGPERVIYARLKGSLSPELATEMGRVAQEGGPDEVQRVLSELGK